jgi:L-ascorbate metabolism protein UlaG (beta-lactamase superfamily)
VRRVLLIGLGLLAIGGLWLTWKLGDRPSLVAMRERTLAVAEPRTGEPRVTFLGVSTLLIEDGRNAILTDGFFSRPGLLRVLLGKLAPDPHAIEAGLKRAGIERLDAVIVTHSHYDHALDAAEVARRTGATLVGSTSTANIGRGSAFPEARMRIVEGTAEMTFGDFRVTLVPSRHLPHGMAMGEIDAPLVPPARALDYREGGSFSIFVEHPRGTLLVQASAGFIDGALAGRQADVVLLGVGGLSTMDEAYHQGYWREVVEAVGARRVIPIHWDDFTRPLTEPLAVMPRLLYDLDATLTFLDARASAARIDLAWLPIAQPVDPFASGHRHHRPEGAR